MNCCRKLFVIGGKAGALIINDIFAAEYQIYFLETFFDRNLLPNGAFLEGKITDHLSSIENYFVATGDNHMRQKITNEIIEKANKYPINLCHPKSDISKTARLGYGNLILSGAVINTNSHIGNGCIINTNSTIEHDNIIGNYTQISPGATLCGYVKVGEFCSISANSTIIPHIEIANNTVIGAGAVVTKNVTEEFCLFAGVPATLKKRYQ